MAMGSGDLLHVPVRVGRGKIKMKSLGSIWKTSYMFYENESCNFKKNKYIYIYTFRDSETHQVMGFPGCLGLIAHLQTLNL